MLKRLAMAAVLLIPSVEGFANVTIGKAAPSFVGVDSNGKSHDLKNYKDKWVVLEWFNEGCPYVLKHYNSKNMQKTQQAYMAKNVVWLTIISSAKGLQGHVDGYGANSRAKEWGSTPTAILLDADGKIGKAYEARTTPHMFVINPEQKVVYAGAIDDKPSHRVESIPGSLNYVSKALDEAMAGKPVTTANTQPYGCKVKY